MRNSWLCWPSVRAYFCQTLFCHNFSCDLLVFILFCNVLCITGGTPLLPCFLWWCTGKSKNTIAEEKTTYGRKQLPGPKLVPTLLLACRRETLLLLEYVQRYSTHLLLVACCFSEKNAVLEVLESKFLKNKNSSQISAKCWVI